MKLLNIKLIALAICFTNLPLVIYAEGCNVENCKTCSSVNAEVCAICEEGYGVELYQKSEDKATCFECNENCDGCGKSYPDNDESKDKIEFCLSCKDSSKTLQVDGRLCFGFIIKSHLWFFIAILLITKFSV